MNLKEKQIGKFLVLIAGIIIFAHAVVPHNHHFYTSDTYSENLECNTTKSDKHGENPETHCHALNIIVSEKSSNVAVNSSLISQLHFDLFDIETNPSLVLNINEIINTTYIEFSPPKSLFLTNLLLRAPPAIV